MHLNAYAGNRLSSDIGMERDFESFVVLKHFRILEIGNRQTALTTEGENQAAEVKPRCCLRTRQTPDTVQPQYTFIVISLNGQCKTPKLRFKSQ